MTTTPSRSPVLGGPTLRIAATASWTLFGLMVVESLLGLVVADLYPEEPWAVAAFRGNDLVTIGLVVPLFAIALMRGRRSDLWAITWFGGLLYGLYNFAYYAFGTAFNDVFLLHVASFTASLVGVIALAWDLDVDGIAGRFRPTRGTRVAAGFLVFVGVALIAAWGGLSLRFALTGELPENLMPPSAVHLVYALDLSLLAPGFVTGGLLLWRRRRWGWVMGAAVALFGTAYLIVLEFVGGFQANEGIGEATWVSPPAIGGAILCALAAFTIFRAHE